MPLEPIPGFCGASYPARARGISAARTVNMYLERNQDPASLTPWTLFPRAGKELFTTIPTSPNNGMWANKTQVFLVAGGFVYELQEDGSATALGAVDMGGNPATMRANGTQLLICSAGKVYIATGTQVYQPIVNFGSGTVDANGVNITWVSGDKFDDVGVGDLFLIESPSAAVYAVQSVTDNEHLVLTGSAGVHSGVYYEVGEEYLTGATCEFIDGYFIVNVPNTKQFRISNLLNGKKWDALDVAQKSGSTDNIAAVADLAGNLALIGDNNSTEVWGDSGNADFPFQRINGMTIPIGAHAPWSIAKMPDGSLIWLATGEGGDERIVRWGGGAVTRISDHALESIMSEYASLSDAVSYSHLHDGHSLYVIHFPSADRAWQYDDTASRDLGKPVWTEIGVATEEDEVYGADPGRFHVHVTWPTGGRMELAADFASGKIWQVSHDFETDDGVEIPLLRVGPHINTNWEWLTCLAFALQCELGTIDPTLLGPDGKALIPTVSMSYSDDGGRLWVDAGAASLGRVGEYGGTELTPAEQADATASSQTNPQVFESWPVWYDLGIFRISRTFKVKSTARMLKAIYAGLVELKK